jgi:GNAT superfamily N-acetyltransferase
MKRVAKLPSIDEFPLVEVTEDSKLLSEVYSLRIVAWRPHTDIHVGIVEWIDEIDGKARHWAILRNGTPIAAVRLSLHEELRGVPSHDVYRGVFADALPTPIASYNRMVVHPDFRGLGLSHRLDEISMETARNMGARVLIGATGSFKHNEGRIRAMIAKGFEVVGRGNAYTSKIIKPETTPTVLVYRF